MILLSPTLAVCMDRETVIIIVINIITPIL